MEHTCEVASHTLEQLDILNRVHQFIDDINSRVFIACTDIESLCKDISLDIFAPFERVQHNAFYGIGTALKQFVGLPHTYNLKIHYSHCSIVSKETVWGHDYKILPILFTWSPYHENIYKQFCRKPMYSIGPIIHYAQNAYSDEKIKAEKERLGKNALLFPTHSTHHTECSFSTEELLEKIETFKNDFDSIRICLYWKDFLAGNCKNFMESGYECVTAGHMLDPYFLPRLKGLLSVADHTFGNSYGTNIAYSIYLNKPFTYIPQEIMYDKNNKALKSPTDLDSWYKFVQPFLNIFNNYSPKITAAQYKLCNYYFGNSHIRTRDELLTLLQESEILFNALRNKLNNINA